MSKFEELFNRTIDIWAMKRWQKYINKELKLHNKYEQKASEYKNKAYHHYKVSKKLYDEYCEKYGK